MGNHHQHEQISKIINQLEYVKQNHLYSILKSRDETEYIKFLYALNNDSNPYHQLRATRTFSIFNKKYLQFRYQSQKDQGKFTHLPKILAFGNQNQNKSQFLSCSYQTFFFVIFEHPSKTLKQEVQDRITSGNQFEEIQLLNLMKSTILGLIQLYTHIKSWNQQVLQRKKFCLNQQNIFIDSKGKFILSDLLVSGFVDVQNHLKQQTVLKRNARSMSLTNLHSKCNYKKSKQTFFQTNFTNLASVVEGILFKFQCFSYSAKNSLQQSQSLSTALQSYRGTYKNSIHVSQQFQNFVKSLQKGSISEYEALGKVQEIIQNITTQKLIQKQRQKLLDETKIKSKRSMSQNFSLQKSSFNITSNAVIPSNSNINDQKRRPLMEINTQTNTFLTKSNNVMGSNNQFVLKLNRFFIDLQANDKNTLIRQVNLHRSVQNAQLNKNNTKIRLSIKKDASKANILICQNTQKTIQSKQNIITSLPTENKKLTRKQSHPKYLCIQNKQNQSIQKNTHFSNDFQAKKERIVYNRQITRSINILNKQINPKKAFINAGKEQRQNYMNQNEDKKQKQKKKVFLKKQFNTSKQVYQCNKKTELITPQMASHMNPITRKKNLGFGKNGSNSNQNNNADNKKKQGVHNNFKTIEKANQTIDIELIENLSSIVSNHNNTLSSYGNPLTQEFKTQHSQIQEQGCIGFTDEFENIQKGKHNQLHSHSHKQSQQGKKHSVSPKFQKSVKLSSYPSIQLVESILQRPQDKIPQFLKQFDLPQKHLVALNNIILKQKDMIMQQSFQQSELNSIRQSVPNILMFQQEINDIKKKRNSKILMDLINIENIKQIKYSENNKDSEKKQEKQENLQFSSIKINHSGCFVQNQGQQSFMNKKYDDSLTNGFRQIEFSVNHY